MRVVLCPRWVCVLCSFYGSVQSLSLSISLLGAAARVHTAGMTSRAAFSAQGPVGCDADNELLTNAQAEKLKTQQGERERDSERGEEVQE